ncbi:hypothetical protein QM007_01820 [Rothia sp. SD9660Na]|nr:hypothetical protein [Rothia sp. SD9660Na]WHS50741.1 hypothetical protein QM007_01820 [Rothia sp. SD9660Na]
MVGASVCTQIYRLVAVPLIEFDGGGLSGAGGQVDVPVAGGCRPQF